MADASEWQPASLSSQRIRRAIVAVDFEAELAGGWTGMVGTDSDVAMAVRDRGVGDVVSLNRGFGRVDFTVVSLYSVSCRLRGTDLQKTFHHQC